MPRGDRWGRSRRRRALALGSTGGSGKRRFSCSTQGGSAGSRRVRAIVTSPSVGSEHAGYPAGDLRDRDKLLDLGKPKVPNCM
jgi:hypothetical protein